MHSPLSLLGCTLAIAALVGSAPWSRAAGAAGWRPFLEEHCLDCHDGQEKKGGLDLEALDFSPSEATHAKWVRVFDRVLAGEMPPPKRSRPDAGKQRDFLAMLGEGLVTQHRATKGTVLRRLNRREYQQTLNDLLGTQVEVVSLLPDDGRAQGFDTVGEALSISSVQMHRYMEAAELALNAALSAVTRPEVTRTTYRMDDGRSAENVGKQWLRREDGAVVFFNDGGFPSTQVPGLRAAAAGRYRVRITGYGYQIAEPVPFAIIAGTFNRGGDQEIRGYYELPPGKAGTVEFMLTLREGDGMKISALGLNGPDGHSPIKDGPAHYPGEGLAIHGVEMEGPLLEEWPPRGQKLLLGEAKLREVPPAQPWLRKKYGYKPVLAAEIADPRGEARKLLPEFLTRAFRRPVGAEEAEPFVELCEAELAQGADFLTPMRTAAIAALCSPEFLYLKEPAGRLDAYALAARLSYFLTRTAPDAELLKLAAARQLTQPATLRAQTERLLRGEGLDRFIADFTDGWLNLREIDFTTPDKQLYPEFDMLLQDSMLRETRGFIRELITANLSLTNLIQSDFAMLNARLARHYDIAGMSGLAMQKVKLPPDSRRGGLLTQGSVLKVSANGTSTSPVIRGVWVLERVLGIHPSPPPPGTPGVEPDIRGAKTVREILAAHRTMESCNGCHRAIDPPGFALESYDVIGGWRDRFRSLGEGQQVDRKVEGRRVRYKLGPPVDAAGELPTGESFRDFAEFQKLLLASRDAVAKCVTEKLLTFATGRAMGFSDRKEINRLVIASKARQHTMRDLVHEVVQSEIFLNK